MFIGIWMLNVLLYKLHVRIKNSLGQIKWKSIFSPVALVYMLMFMLELALVTTHK